MTNEWNYISRKGRKKKEGRDDVPLVRLTFEPRYLRWSASKEKRRTFDCINNLMFLLLFLSVRVVLQLWKDLVLCEPIANTDHVWLDNQCWGFWGQRALLRGHVAAATMTTHPPRQWDQPQSWKCSDGKERKKKSTKTTKSAKVSIAFSG